MQLATRWDTQHGANFFPRTDKKKKRKIRPNKNRNPCVPYNKTDDVATTCEGGNQIFESKSLRWVLLLCRLTGRPVQWEQTQQQSTVPVQRTTIGHRHHPPLYGRHAHSGRIYFGKGFLAGPATRGCGTGRRGNNNSRETAQTINTHTQR